MNDNTPFDNSPFDAVTGEKKRDMTPLESFYHLFQIERHSYETEAAFEERKRTKEIFVAQLDAQGLTPADLLSQLQSLAEPPKRPKIAAPDMSTPLFKRMMHNGGFTK